MTQQKLLMTFCTLTIALIPIANASEKTDNTDTKALPDAPSGWIILQDDFWLPLTHEPGLYFHRAHQAFLEKDRNTTAIELRQAAAFIRIEARRSSYTEHANALYAAANRLSNLATQVEERKVKSAAELDREFARAHYTLANHDYAMAQETWKEKRPYTTGFNLNAAVFNIESGYNWANADMGKTGFNAVADASTLADNLIAGAPQRYEVNATLDAVHEAINNLSRQVDNLPKDPGLAMDGPAFTAAPECEPGWVLVEDDIWTELPNSAGQHLSNAYEAYLQRQAGQAASEIHRAVFDLELQAGRAIGKDRTELTDAIGDLKALLNAEDSTQANLKLSHATYEQAIAGACYALAKHHCEMAQIDWAKQLKTTAGYDLKWAANYLDRGRVWADQLASRTAESRLHDARQLSEALIAGNADLEQNVATRIETLDTEVTALHDAVYTMAN